VPSGTDLESWVSGLVAGFVASTAMAFPLHFIMDMLPMIAALYGAEGVAAGFVAHTFHSLVFALIYVVAFSVEPMRTFASNFPANIATGAVYGVALWVFGSVVIMPVWLASIGMSAPAVPNIVPMSLLAHILFGVVLGVVYPVILREVRG